MAANSFQQVITYNRSGLAFLQNNGPVLSICNKKYKNFNDDVPQNLGSSVDFTLQPRFITNASLVASVQGVTERFARLTIDQPFSVAYQFTSQEFIFNAREFMDLYGRGAIQELGSKVEAYVSKSFETNTYRFFGDGVTPINSYLQLANALAFFRNYGAAPQDTKGVLSDLTFPGIVNSGLNQFVPRRNDKMAMSWDIGNFSNCDWYQSNLLPIHTSGTEGTAGSTLTVVSTTTNAAGQITAITFSGTAGALDPDSIKAYDKLVFNDGVTGFTDVRYLTFVGHEVSGNPVQFRAENNAQSTGANQVTVNIYPYLQVGSGPDQNINTPIVAGMQVSVLRSHRCGVIMSGNPLFLGMPKLPDTTPFDSSTVQDPETGASLRTYWGTKFGQDEQMMVHDCIVGKKLVDEYAMMVALPV